MKKTLTAAELNQIQESEYINWMREIGSELQEEYRSEWQYGTGEDLNDED